MFVDYVIGQSENFLVFLPDFYKGLKVLSVCHENTIRSSSLPEII